MTKSWVEHMLQNVSGPDLIFSGGVLTMPRHTMLCRER
jgi:hypothetical protein